MKNNSIKNIIIVVAIILIFSLLYIIIDKVFNDDSSINLYLKNYKVNEYIPIYVSDEQMAEIYLNDYIHKIYFDINGSYELLDAEYRKQKNLTLESYKSYIYSLNLSSNMKKYYVIDKDGYLYFGVYDSNGNILVFKTNGVMQYTVYLDNYTVEI